MESSLNKIKYRTYEAAEITSALNDITNNKISISAAASKKHNIPRTTLRRYIKDDSIKHLGREPVLSKDLEKELVEWACYLDEIGCGVTKSEFCQKAGELSAIFNGENQFKAETPSNGWLSKFMKRHQGLSFRKQSYLSRASVVVSEQDLRNFYAKIYNYIEKHNHLDLLNCPERWINGDETNFQLNSIPPKVLSKKGKKVVYRVERGKPKESVTGMYSFSADGHMYKPLYIFNEKITNMPDIGNACIEVGAKFGFAQTGNGWQNPGQLCELHQRSSISRAFRT